MVNLYGRTYSRAELFQRIGRLDQIAGITAGEFTDGPQRGVRHLDLRSGGGLEARVLVDRGFDIGELRFNGLPLSWRSPNGFRAPGLHAAEDDKGAGLLRSMDGLMVTCGLDHVRGAAEGPAGHFGPRREATFYPLHGRISQTPAQLVGYGEIWQQDDCLFHCEGIVRQSMMYGEVLDLHRRIESPLGSNIISITDRIINQGHRPTPHMLLYHLNFGFPFLDQDTCLLLPESIAPNPERKDFLQQKPPFDEAADEILEVQPKPRTDGRVSAAIANATLGGGMAIEIDYDATMLPALQIWRHFGPGMNVVAIEPATNRAARRPDLEHEAAIRFLQPGEELTYRLTVSVHHGADALRRLTARIGTD